MIRLIAGLSAQYFGRLERCVAASDLQDVARMQMSIYNDLSDLHLMIRGANHNTLEKNRNDDASTGAGCAIIVDEDTAPEKRPYLLQADANALLGLLDAMERKEEMDAFFRERRAPARHIIGHGKTDLEGFRVTS